MKHWRGTGCCCCHAGQCWMRGGAAHGAAGMPGQPDPVPGSWQQLGLQPLLASYGALHKAVEQVSVGAGAAGGQRAKRATKRLATGALQGL